MNENWSRWIFASLSKYFDTGKGDIANFHVQGTVLNTSSDIERGEIRWTGADFTEQSRKQYKIEFTISVLITVPLGQGDNHRIQRLVGRFASLAEGPIEIKSYGEVDDPELIGCANIKGKVRTHDWGQIFTDVKVTQSSVESDFVLELQET